MHWPSPQQIAPGWGAGRWRLSRRHSCPASRHPLPSRKIQRCSPTGKSSVWLLKAATVLVTRFVISHLPAAAAQDSRVCQQSVNKLPQYFLQNRKYVLTDVKPRRRSGLAGLPSAMMLSSTKNRSMEELLHTPCSW